MYMYCTKSKGFTTVSILLGLSTEIRTHGVGYYGFASEEDKRHEQLQMLNDLRDEVGYYQN